MARASDGRDVRYRYIDVLRSMNPDTEMKRRLDALERQMQTTPTVIVTRSDLEDYVRPLMAYMDSSAVDEVVDEIDGRLGLVGEHPMTTALRPDTVAQWVGAYVEEEIGRTELASIIENAIT